MRSCRLLLLALGLSAAPAFADDAKKPDAPPAPKQDVIKFEGKTASELLLSVKKQGGRLASKEDFEAAAKALDLAAGDPKATPEEQKEIVSLKTRVLYMGAQRHKDAFSKAFDAHAADLAKRMPGSDEAALAHGFSWIGKYMKPDRTFKPEGEGELMELAKTYVKSSMIGQLVGMYADGMEDDAKSLAFLKKAVAELGDAPVAASLKGMLANKSIMGSVMEIAGPTLDGKTFNVADHKGKVILVDFWATWCGPCVGEIPHVKKVYEKLKDKGFMVVAVSLDQEKETLAKFVKEKELPWPQIFFADAKGECPLATKYAINAIPATFLIGKDGKVIARDLRGEAKLEKAVLEALGK